MKTRQKTKLMRGRFAALRQWVVIVQRHRKGPWIVVPALPPFVLVMRSAAPEMPWLDKLMKAVEDVKKAPSVLVQKRIMKDALTAEPLHFLPPSVRDHGPVWEALCQYLRLRTATLDGQYVAVRLLAPGGLVAAHDRFRGKKRKPITTGIVPAIALRGMGGELRHSIAADVSRELASELPSHDVKRRSSTIKISPKRVRS